MAREPDAHIDDADGKDNHAGVDADNNNGHLSASVDIDLNKMYANKNI